MAPQFILTMKDLRKVTPQGKEILKGIWLSFYPDAKIGVLGHNGAGKSTLLRIMAGLDKDFAGEAFPAEGTRIGHLPQEPQLDPGKKVQQHVEEAVAPLKALLARFEDLSMKLGEDLPEAEMDKVIEEQARVQDRIDAANAWEVDRTVEIAMDALRLPPGDADVTKLSGGERRRVALCRLLLQPSDMLLLDEPTNHLDAESVAWLERFLKEYKGLQGTALQNPAVQSGRRPGAPIPRGHATVGAGGQELEAGAQVQCLAYRRQGNRKDGPRQASSRAELQIICYHSTGREALRMRVPGSFDGLTKPGFSIIPRGLGRFRLAGGCACREWAQ